MTHFHPSATCRNILRGTVAAAGLALLAGAPVQADPPHCPPGLERQGRCGPGDHHRHDRRDEARAYEQGYRDGQRDAWRIGDRFEREEYVVVREYSRYQLSPPPHGHYYVRVDDEVLLIDAATRIVADLVD
ncbi:MAG: excinuclease ABC subunit A [Maricaulis sp.]|nr:excinuclease ABC subunit A [Oceanicaulis sp.]MAZ91774.1 excinuclease ABC subunit A [Maricaulis sp.]